MGQLRAFQAFEFEGSPPKHEVIFGLLRRAGFANAVWRRPIRHQWSVVGDFDGTEVIVTCMLEESSSGFYLQVQSPKAREWLLDFLAEHDWWDTDVRVEPLEEEATPPPWIALTVVIGAVALFGWVVTSIGLKGG